MPVPKTYANISHCADLIISKHTPCGRMRVWTIIGRLYVRNRCSHSPGQQQTALSPEQNHSLGRRREGTRQTERFGPLETEDLLLHTTHKVQDIAKMLFRLASGNIRFLQTRTVQSTTERTNGFILPRLALLLGMMGIGMSSYSTHQLMLHHKSSSRIMW